MILTQQLNTNAAKNIGKAAFRYLGKETSYNDLKTKIAKLSYLYLHEIGSGARVAFIARNCPAYIASFYAFSNTKSVSIPIDPDRSPEEIAEWLKESEATHVAVSNDLASKVKDILNAYRLALPIIEMEKKQGGEYASSFTPPPDSPPLDVDPIVLFRTNGYSGKSKFVSFNHKQLIAAATAVRGLYHLSGTDRFYTRMPWSHPMAFIHSMVFPTLNNSTCVIDHGAEGKELLDFLVESRITRMINVPSFYLKLLLICRDEKRRIPAAVKSIIVAGGRLSGEVEKTMGLMKIPVSHVYGMTEAGWTIAMIDCQEEGEHISPSGEGLYVGKGLPGFKYKVIDNAGDEIEGSEAREGMLCVTGPSIMGGYYKNEKETKNTIRGTWLYTGDFARLEGEGDELKITFLGRREDILRIDNQVILPNAIDKAARGFPGVADAAGFVTPNSKGQSRFVCAVVKTAAGAVNEKMIMEKIASSVSADAVPVAVVFADVIPRDFAGNVNRMKLAAQFSGAAG